MVYGSDIEESGSDTESGSSSSDSIEIISSSEEEIDETSDKEVVEKPDEEDDFGPEVPERIVWRKPMFSRRVLQVRRGVEKAWRLRQAAKTVNLRVITQGKGYQLVKAACQEVQKKL